MRLNSCLFRMFLFACSVWAKNIDDLVDYSVDAALFKSIENITDLNYGVNNLINKYHELQNSVEEEEEERFASLDRTNKKRYNEFHTTEYNKNNIAPEIIIYVENESKASGNIPNEMVINDNNNGLINSFMKHGHVDITRQVFDDTNDFELFLKQYLPREYFINKKISQNEKLLRKDALPSNNILFTDLKTMPISLKSLKGNMIGPKENLLYILHNLKDDKKADVIIFTNVKKTEDTNEDSVMDTQENKMEEKAKSAILRKGCIYCIKVVVRKCYKALTRSVKNICRQYSCKTGFKKLFKSNSKTGCLREIVNDTRHDKNDTRRYNVSHNINQKVYFVDVTRSGYFDCGTAVIDPKENTKHNILRDKYERACQKSSYNKCVKACTYATNTTCEKYKCMERKKKKFNKVCKRECKIFFDIEDSSDGTESSDSSDSDSSTDTD